LKAAKLAEAERKDALIDEGLSILSRLDADGKDRWSEGLARIILALRNGAQ
jgi:hypothetical protein